MYAISTSVTKIISSNPWRSGIALSFSPRCCRAGADASFLSKNMSSSQMRLSLQHANRSWFILGTFKHFCRVTHFQRKWRPTEHWTTLMQLYHVIPEPLKFNGNDLSNVLRKDPSMQIEIKWDQDLPNFHGIYRDQYKPGWRKTHCYYACKPGEEYVHALPKEKKWYDSISSIPKLQKECDAIARSTQRVPKWCHRWR